MITLAHGTGPVTEKSLLVASKQLYKLDRQSKFIIREEKRNFQKISAILRIDGCRAFLSGLGGVQPANLDRARIDCRQ